MLRRPRFSLLTLFLLLTIAAMAMGMWRSGRELARLRIDVRRLRDEVGGLSIGDETKMHAIQVRTNEELFWKWRFWIPEGMEVDLKFLRGDTTLEGYPTPEIVRHRLRAGEQWVTIRVREIVRMKTARMKTGNAPSNVHAQATPSCRFRRLSSGS